jgi:DNA-directed RNA polymerase specialized sigma24 family protein
MQQSSETAGPVERSQRAAFAGTRWSVVMKARNKESPEARKALSELCGLYWYPLYAFVRRSGHGHHEAEDMTQGFFQHLISKDGLVHVDPAKGKFRSFLISSMKNFLTNERERSGALKRGGGQVPVSIDMAAADGRYSCELADTSTPEAVYDRQWAMTLLETVMNILKHEYESRGKSDVFDALHENIAGNAGGVVFYSELAVRLDTTEGNLKIMVHRLRRQFGEALRKEIAQTVESDADVDDEIRHLMACLSK